MKPVEKVIAEIREIKRIWPHPFIEFADDNSSSTGATARSCCARSRSERVRWFTETDIAVADDEELLDLMRERAARRC